MTVQINNVESILTSRGYRVIHETSKKRGYQLADRLPVYLNLKSASGETALVAHPESDVEALRIHPHLKVGHDYFHSSNMGRFPRRMHRGAQPIAYGWGITFITEAAVHACLDLLEGNSVPMAAAEVAVAKAPREEQGAAPMLGEGADLATHALRRVGHDQFRAALLAQWGECSVTGLVNTRLLRASHIKPWAAATPQEKTDPFNGLLLAPQLDAAFDAGLLTFGEEGQVMLSQALSAQDAQRLGLSVGLRLRKLDPRHKPYLRFHREEVFVA